MTNYNKLSVNILNKVFILILLVVSVLSCIKRNNTTEGNLYLKNENISKITDSIRTESVFKKIENDEKLFDKDYKILFNFILNNNDVSLSEQLGLLMFQYFQGQTKRNNDLKSYLIINYSKEENNKILSLMINYMSIDITDNYNSYTKFAVDFPMFPIDNDFTIKVFNECLENTIE